MTIDKEALAEIRLEHVRLNAAIFEANQTNWRTLSLEEVVSLVNVYLYAFSSWEPSR